MQHSLFIRLSSATLIKIISEVRAFVRIKGQVRGEVVQNIKRSSTVSTFPSSPFFDLPISSSIITQSTSPLSRITFWHVSVLSTDGSNTYRAWRREGDWGRTGAIQGQENGNLVKGKSHNMIGRMCFPSTKLCAGIRIIFKHMTRSARPGVGAERGGLGEKQFLDQNHH